MAIETDEYNKIQLEGSRSEEKTNQTYTKLVSFLFRKIVCETTLNLTTSRAEMEKMKTKNENIRQMYGEASEER